MTINPRHFLVTQAEVEFLRLWIGIQEKYDLTTVENLRILQSAQNIIISQAIKAEWEETKNERSESGQPDTGGQETDRRGETS